MGVASRYWQFVRLNAAGRCITEEIIQAREFFRQQFAELASQVEVQDSFIQRQLLQLLRGTSEDSRLGASSRSLAERCLRCFISSQIQQVCIRLEAQFGREHGFTRYDLLPFVLDNVSVTGARGIDRSQSSSYQFLATEILQTFDPDQSGLAAWTTRLVRHCRELNACLLEHGVYLVSDWAILNDTNLRQLQRIFSEFHQLTILEMQDACTLLECYHAVYRHDRLGQRQAKSKKACQQPTMTQLNRIAHCFHNNTTQELSPEDVLARLQDLAKCLRQYRISVRRRSPPTESLDAPEICSQASGIQSINPLDGSNEPDNQTEFLRLYRQQFIHCLDQAIEQVQRVRLSYLHRRDPQQAQRFIPALRLYYCQGKSMGQIAPLVGLRAQYQVTRLLRLRDFRADIRQRMLERLRGCILDIAKDYVHPDRLQSLDNQVEVALDEQINAAIADVEATATGDGPRNSLFTQQLCRHLLQTTNAQGQG